MQDSNCDLSHHGFLKCWIQDIGVKRQFLLARDAALGPKK